VSVGTCGFDSRLRHQINSYQGFRGF